MFFETPESPRVLKTDFFDFFTRSHWVSVPVLFVPIALASFGWSVTRAGVPWYTSLGVAVSGFVVWTFTEYWLHRTVFHWAPDTPFGRTFHYWVHGIHHELPDDPYRLVMPPWVNLSLLFLVVAPLALWIAPAWGYAFLAGFVLGYANYDTTHYWLHHSKPSRPYFKRLKAHHMNHHFNKQGRRFGVSVTFWDRVFGTL